MVRLANHHYYWQSICVGTKIVVPGKKLTCTVPVDNGPIGKTDVVVSINGVKSNTTDFAKFEYVQAEVTRVEPKEGQRMELSK